MTEKLWGTTMPLLATPFIEIHWLTIEPRMCCSWHKHERKWNAFVLIHGDMNIEHESGGLFTIVNLRSRVGNFYAVPPGEYHRFVTGQFPVDALEIYYPDTLSEDIIRRDVGGLLRDMVADAPQESAKPLEKVA